MTLLWLVIAGWIQAVGPGEGGDVRLAIPATVAPPPPWSALILENCPAQLASAGVSEFTMLPEDFTERVESPHGERICHVPQAMRYLRGPGDIRYTTYMLVNCRMAVALARFERVAQRVAREKLGPRARVRTIVTLGAFACRPLRANHDVMSQHGYGNALDLRRIMVERFGAVDVERHWDDDGTRRGGRASRYLHALADALRTEHMFMNVITPNEDRRGHKNHMHVDMDPIRPDSPVAPLLDEPVWDVATPDEVSTEPPPPAPRTLDIHFEGAVVLEPSEEE